jgi:hypothetical protein
MTIDPILTSRRNVALRLLKHEVDDDRFIQIFADFSKIIRRSEEACARAAKSENSDYEDFVAETESDYLEEIIGASFLVLQAKIRRVKEAFAKLGKHMEPEIGAAIPELRKDVAVKIQGPYKGTGDSLVQLIWDVGNYYKHRDEWGAAVWKPAPIGSRDGLRQARATRASVERIGITRGSTGNLRTAYEFFGIDPYSKCEELAEEVQSWAKEVLAFARSKVDAIASRRTPTRKGG